LKIPSINYVNTFIEIAEDYPTTLFKSFTIDKTLWLGVHNNKDRKIKLYGVETGEYKKYSADKKLKVVKAMRSRRK